MSTCEHGMFSTTERRCRKRKTRLFGVPIYGHRVNMAGPDERVVMALQGTYRCDEHLTDVEPDWLEAPRSEANGAEERSR